MRIAREFARRILASSGFNKWLGLISAPNRWRRRSAPPICEARSILIIKADEIGDVVLATGFIRTIRRLCPKARVILAVRQLTRPLVEGTEFADDILTWNERWRSWPFGIKNWIHLVRSARRVNGGLDWVLIPRSCGDHMNMALFAWWTGAKAICAHESLCTEWGPDRRSLVDLIVPRSRPLHEVSQNQRMLALLGIHEPAEPHLSISAEDRVCAATTLGFGGTDRTVIALGIGAGNPSRRWPMQNFAELIRALLKVNSALWFTIVGDASVADDAEILRSIQPSAVRNLCGRLTLRQTAAALEHCAVFVGNDSGPMHIAAAMGCAVVELSKHPVGADELDPTSPLRFGPRAVSYRILRSTLDRGLDTYRSWEPDTKWIASIRVESVVDATLALVELTKSTPHSQRGQQQGANA